MKKVVFLLSFLTIATSAALAQQLPNAGFEDWSGATFDGEIQPASWNASNVTQAGLKFNFAHREAGHTGSYSMRVSDQEVGAAGITEVSPGYFALGNPWVYISSITVSGVQGATAGTSGGIDWTYRPDSMAVWIKRTGGNTDKERFYLVYYAWKGQSRGDKFKGKNGNCTSHTEYNEESDIRISMDMNQCGTAVEAQQVAEGQWSEFKAYNDWTRITVPIYYMRDEAPEKMNIIFSASRYPEQRANSGLYQGNNLFVDDVELKYSDKIQKLYIGGKDWKAFDPDNTGVQEYSVGASGSMPTAADIIAIRGAGSMTSTMGTKVTFQGRHLSSSEMTISGGTLDGDPMRITVQSGDGKTSRTYQIRFVTAVSTNAKLASISVNGEDLSSFSPLVTTYSIALPYGTTEVPQVAAEAEDGGANVVITQPTSVNGTATIMVTAPSGATKTYTLNFSVAQLSDNTLKDIEIDGESLAGFSPNTTYYKVSIPEETTQIPEIKAVSAYPAGAQTITDTVIYTTPGEPDGAQYQILVSTPGNPTPKVYKLNLKKEASSYAYLKDLQVGDSLIKNFDAQQLTYPITLGMGTTAVPTITYTPGDKYQSVAVENGGLDGTTRIIVTAGDGTTQVTYKLYITTEKSTRSDLKAIVVGGDTLQGFSPDQTNYSLELPQGTTAVPEITVIQGDEYESVKIIYGGVNGTTRILVSAGDGSSTVYQITFSVKTSSDATLKMIYIDGDSLKGFEPTKLEYTVELAEGTKSVPTVTYEQHDPYQTVVTRAPQSLPGKYRLTVRPQTGSSQVYVITMKVKSGEGGGDPDPEKEKSSNCNLSSIRLNGTPIAGFEPNTLAYTQSLPSGATYPTVSYTKADSTASASVGPVGEGIYAITVMAENGDQKTYTVTFEVAAYDGIEPLKIVVGDTTLLDKASGIGETETTYTLVLGEGAALPTVIVIPDSGQDIAITTQNRNTQTILVTAQSGRQQEYTIHYTREVSHEAKLKDILVDGKSLAGFRPDSLNYTYTTLKQGTKVIPSVHPVGQQTNQTIVTEYCRPGGTVRIEVTAADNTTKTVYTVAFPVAKSANANLKTIEMEGLEGFASNIETYDVELADTATMVPAITYMEAVDASARIDLESRPLGDTTIVTVVAEDGTSKAYRLYVHRKEHTEANELKTLKIQETGEVLDVQNESTFSVTLPYNATTFNIEYAKNYETQTVVVENGGFLQPTVITVKANRADEADKVYTITAKREATNPATLTSITVDGTAIADFEPERFTYVVGRTNTGYPTVTYTAASGVNVSIKEVSNQRWKAEVSKGGYTNSYTLFFHYVNDVIPNGEFTDWTSAATRTSAKKPTSWQVAADYYDTYAGTAKTGSEVTQSGDKVKMTTKWWAALGGPMPSVITLGALNFTPTVAGQTTSKFYGGIDFRNTPDSCHIGYYYKTKKGDGALFAIRFWENGTETNYDYTTTSTTGGYVEKVQPLSTDGKVISQMNLAVNATNQEKGAESGAELYVDYFRFVYNSRMTGATVNGEGATMNGNTFEVELTNPLQPATPICSFEGEVSDQGQQIIWANSGQESKEGNYAVKTGTVRNYAEDGSYMDYTLRVKRVMESRHVLQALYADGKDILIEGTTTYEVPVSTVDKRFPDITTDVPSPLMMVSKTWSGDSTLVLTVEAENGEQTKYTVRFVTIRKSGTELKSIAVDGSAIADFDPATRTYSIDAQEWPAVTYEKAYDQQTVRQTGHILEVTAEDGSKSEYTLTLAPKTNGVLEELELTGLSEFNFSPTTYDYTNIKTRPSNTAFTREARRDSVVFTQTEKWMQWHVMGTEETKTYTIYFPTEVGYNAALGGIVVDGDSVPDVDKLTDLEVEVDGNIELRPLGDEGQTIVTTRSGKTYTIVVTAEDEQNSMTYHVTLTNQLSHDALLRSIELDTTLVPGFAPETKRYEVVLPFVGGVDSQNERYKMAQPQLPDLSYTVLYPRTTVEVSPAPLDDTTQLFVTAEDGINHATYQVLMSAEKSHYAFLSGITVNDTAVSFFEPNRHVYATEVSGSTSKIGWQSPDGFIRVTMDTLRTSSGGLYTLNVTSEDGQEKQTYTLFVTYGKLGSADSLKMIYEDGADLEGYTPSTHYYHRILPVGAEFPEVSWEEENEGQVISLDTISRESNSQTLQIKVVSPSGKTGYYTVQYDKTLSAVDTLKMIYVNNLDLPGYRASTTEYSYTLPVGSTEIPNITYELGEDNGKIYSTARVDTLDDPYQQGKHLRKLQIVVTAQNGNQRTYTIHFPIALSSDTTLEAIYFGGERVPDFDSETFVYRKVRLAKGVTTVPVISVTKKDEAQQVTIEYVDALTVRVVVTAEDGASHGTYTIHFVRYDSDCATLAGIALDSVALQGFSAGTNEYTIELPYGTTTLPVVTWTAGAEDQTVVEQVDSLSGRKGEVTLSVTSPDGTESFVYTISFTVALNSDASLRDIVVWGASMKGFDTNKTEYEIVYADTCSMASFFDAGTMQAIPTDSLATVRVTSSDDTEQEERTIVIVVTAQDGTERVTQIVQRRALSGNSLLQSITLNGVEIADFSPTTFTYTYWRERGVSTMPEVVGVPQDKRSEVGDPLVMPQVGDTIPQKIVCTAEDGTESVYMVYFVETPINDALDPQAEDVIVKVVDGSKILVSTLRRNVSFGLYDPAGREVGFIQNIDVPDPNNAITQVDANGTTVLIDVKNLDGNFSSIRTNQVYVYCFYRSGKYKICSGKMYVH